MSNRPSLRNPLQRAVSAGLAFLERQPLVFFALAAMAGMAAYRFYAGSMGVLPGFPLDDAWIHQTYARNLIQYGEFAFVPGEPSAGSTAPLWSLLLSLGYFLHLPYWSWTLFLGWISLTLCGWGAWLLSLAVFPRQRNLAFAAGTFCVLEWHLVWAAMAGMETALFTALMVLTLAAALSEPADVRRGILVGLLGGALTLTRPEGMVLVALIGAGWLIGHWREHGNVRIRPLLGLATGFLLFVMPYLLLNYRLSGTLFPNTFYAKQAEYREIRASLSLPARWLKVIAPTLVGPQILLIPGFIWAAGLAVRTAWWRWKKALWVSDLLPNSALPALYWLLFTAIYAVRLPVTYQHGRYLMPSIPLLVVFGLGGSLDLVARLRREETRRLVGTAILLALLLMGMGFITMGARTYAQDVAIINGEMVAVARWIEAHTPADARIAAHDIGAIGYFAGRPLIDLAGLVTPEVIPFIRDEERLWEFIQAQGADYLVTFPSWYPQMTARPELRMVFQTDTALTRQMGSDNMAVYAILNPKSGAQK